MMRIGLALPHYPFSFPSYEGDLSLARRALDYGLAAEQLGFHQLWASDHLWIDVAPPGSAPQHQEPAECWTLLAALAARTHTVGLGSLVTPVGLRNRDLLLRTVETVQALCDGRLDVGIGAGWNAEEFTHSGIAFPSAAQRLVALSETIGCLRSMDRGPAVWVGGKRSGLLKVAATADGWNTAWSLTLGDYRERAERLAQACVANGRDPATVRRSVGLVTLVGHDQDDLADRWRALQRWAPGGALDEVALRTWAARRLVGTPKEIRRQVHEWQKLGIEQIICAPGAPFAVYDDEQLALLASSIVPAAESMK